MNYVRTALAPGETVQSAARLHWVLWLRAWAALLILGWILVGVYFFVRDALYLTSTEVALTNRRLILKTGLFHRETSELVLSSIEAVKISQGFWGRLLAFGRVQVHGTGAEVWVTPLIAFLVAFRRAIAAASPAEHAASA